MLPRTTGLLTLAFRKADRGDRVFVDWMRNSSRSTSVVPWSLRPKGGASVATPISWQELGEIEPDGIGLRNVRDRSRKRPWSKLQPIDLGLAVEKVRNACQTMQPSSRQPFDRFRSLSRARPISSASLPQSPLTRARSKKIELLAAMLRRLAPDGNCAGDLLPER